MIFNASDVRAPEGLRTDEFLLRPIRASDAERDYEAVMESREFLRRWEQSSWPTDDFTVDANRKDMEKLERRHTGGESFTYAVLNPTERNALVASTSSPPPRAGSPGRRSPRSMAPSGRRTRRPSSSGFGNPGWPTGWTPDCWARSARGSRTIGASPTPSS